MIERKVSIESITVFRNGDVSVLLALDVVEGTETITRKNHRVTVATGGSVDSVMADASAHISSKGWPGITASDVSRVRSIKALV